MRMLLRAVLPVEPSNAAIKSGALAKKIEDMMNLDDLRLGLDKAFRNS